MGGYSVFNACGAVPPEAGMALGLFPRGAMLC